jgi:hypothetical protein
MITFSSNAISRRLAATLAILAIPVASAIAGGIDRFPIGLSDIPRVWPANSGSNTFVSFSVVRHQDASGTFLAPNFAYTQSIPTTVPSTQWPGMRSCVAAASAWTVWSTPGYAFTLAKRFFYTSPSLGPVVSAASSNSPLTTTPPAGSAIPQPPLIFAPDGVNMVNMYEPGATFGPIGGPLPFGLAIVYTSGTTATIFEADIAINSRSADAAGNPIYSFVEETNGLNRTFATSTTYPSSTFVAPTLGYVSLLGVLVHEFGHAAGIAHSIVTCESTPSLNDSATMNIFGVQDGQRSFSLSLPAPSPAYGYVTQDVLTSTTNFKGYYAKSQETLSLDDYSAMIEGYPGTQATTSLGSIAGTVLQAPALGNVGTAPVWGANVVAFDVNDPSRRRVSRLTLRNGSYRIDGLPPGTYALEVAPIDFGGSVSLGAQLPTFVSGGLVAQGFFSEYYGGPTSDFLNENGLHRVYTPIVVTAGSVAASRDFSVQAIPQGGSDPLNVTVTTQTSNLGVGTPPGGVPPAPFIVIGPTGQGAPIFDSLFPTTLTYQVNAGFANAGGIALLRLAERLGRTDYFLPPSSMQLFGISDVAQTVVPISLDVTGSGSVVVQYQLSDDLDSQYAQATWNDATTGAVIVSNMVRCLAINP